MAREDGGFLLWPGVGGKDPGLSYGSLEMRRRIAQQLAAQKRAFPKNVGEGLTYLGESIGEAGALWRLEQEERARSANLAGQVSKLYPDEQPKASPPPASTKPAPAPAAKPAPAPAPAPVSEAPVVPPNMVADASGGGDWPGASRFDAVSDTGQDIGPASFATRFDAAAGAEPQAPPEPTARMVPTTSFRRPDAQAELPDVHPGRAAVFQSEHAYTPPAEPFADRFGSAEQFAPSQQTAEMPMPRPRPDTMTAELPMPRPRPDVMTADLPMPRPRPGGDLPAQAAMTPPGQPGNVQSWYDFSVRPREQGGLGLSHEQAAAKVANLQAESGQNIRPWGVTGDGGTAFGAAQWRGPRFAALQQFAAERGLDHRTTEAQQAFMRHEYDTTERGAYQRLIGAKTPAEAATAINRYYERSADRRGWRESNAVRLANTLGPGGNYADPAVASAATARPPEAAAFGTEPDQRDLIAAALIEQGQQKPQQQAQAPTEEDAAAEARFNQAMGMRRPGSPFLARATAFRGDIGSDAPMPGLSPLGSATGAGIADTVQQRGRIYDAVQRQQGPAVPPVDSTQAATMSPQSTQTGTGSSPATVSDIQPAPVGVRPNDVLAQAGPGVPAVAPVPPIVRGPPTAPYEMQKMAEPEAPKRAPRSREEINALRLKASNPGDPDIAAIVDPIIANEQKKRDDDFARATDAYKSKLSEVIKHNTEVEKQWAGRGKAAADEANTWEAVRKARSSASDQERFGRDPEKFFASLDKDKGEAQQITHQLNMNRLAIKAINAGVVTGWGSNFRLDTNRLASFAANNGMSGDLAANTQILAAALKGAVGEAVRNIQGGAGANVSNTDVKLAEKAAGADPSLELGAIKQILSTSNRLSSEKLNDYEDRRDHYLKNHPAYRDYVLPNTETAPQPYIAKLVAEPTPENKKAFDDRFGTGSADLEINRHKRRNR